MAKLQTAIRGTQDVLPKDSYKWQYVEKTLLETAGLFGFSEMLSLIHIWNTYGA